MDTNRVDALIERSRQGDLRARDALLVLANEEIERLARKKLSAFPIVHAWHDTADVGQIALIQVDLALAQVELADSKHFYRLVAMKVRQTLLQLKREICGPQGIATNMQHALIADDSSGAASILSPSTDTHDPRKLAEWLEIHDAIAALSEEDRQTFDLLWYNELTAEAAAAILGVSPRQVRRRWRAALIRLASAVRRPFQ